MSLTRDEAERASATFFDAELAPLGRALQAAGAQLADVAPHRAADSHYTPAPAFGKADFALPAVGDAETLRAALFAQWADTPDLQPLADKVAQLFEQIGVEIEQSSEVSPFVYVMF